jgi:hypothetical protein
MEIRLRYVREERRGIYVAGAGVAAHHIRVRYRGATGARVVYLLRNVFPKDSIDNLGRGTVAVKAPAV